MPEPAVDEDEIGPRVGLPASIGERPRWRQGFSRGSVQLLPLLLQAAEPAAHDFAHHAVVVAGLDVLVLDVELAVAGFFEAFRPGHNHAAHHVRAHDVTVVIDLDASGRFGQVEHLLYRREDLLLALRLRQLAAQRLARVQVCLLDNAALLAALGQADFHLVLGFHFERVGHQLGFLDAVAEKDQLRHRLVVVELREEGRQHLFGCVVAIVFGIPDGRAPVLPRAEEEGLHRGLPSLAVNGEHVGLDQAVRIDALALAHGGQRADAITQGCCALIVHVRCRAFHLGGELFLQSLGVAIEEAFGFAHEIAVLVQRDQARAWR